MHSKYELTLVFVVFRSKITSKETLKQINNTFTVLFTIGLHASNNISQKQVGLDLKN
jgi:hypothetical protein